MAKRVSESTKDTIRLEYSLGVTTQKQLAEKHGISIMTVNKIVSKKTEKENTDGNINR